MAYGHFENQSRYDGGSADIEILEEYEASEANMCAQSIYKDGDDIRGYELYTEVCSQLNLYFEGKLKNFDLPLKPVGTDFQKKVWRALMNNSLRGNKKLWRNRGNG